MSVPFYMKRVTLGRLQLGLRVYRHTGVLPDRWVIQPEIIYDRKRHRTRGAA